MPKKINVTQEIKNFNERLRQAEKKYGAESRIVKMMRDKANQLMPEWTEKDGKIYRISTKTKVDSGYEMKRFRRYIIENRASELIKEKLSEEDYSAMKKLKGEERVKHVLEVFNRVEATKELCGRIWDEMYNAGYSPDECNEVYDELMNGNFTELLERYKDGEITAPELGAMVLAKINDDIFSQYDEFEESDFNDF